MGAGLGDLSPCYVTNGERACWDRYGKRLTLFVGRGRMDRREGGGSCSSKEIRTANIRRVEVRVIGLRANAGIFTGV